MDIKKVLQNVADRYKTDDEMDTVGKGLGEINRQVDALKRPVTAPAKKPIPASPADRVNPMGKYGDKPGEQRIDVDQMVKPLGKMHQGGPVNKSGAYILKKGEHVLTPEHKSTMKHALGLAEGVLSHEPAKEEEPKKEIESMTIKKGKSGGHIMTHRHKMPHIHPDEDHVTSTKDDMLHHVMAHMSEPNDGEMEAEAGHSGIPGEMPPSSGTQQMAQAIGGQ